MGLGGSWHEIYTTCNNPAIEVRPLCKLSGICVPRTMLKSFLVSVMLRPLLKTDIFQTKSLELTEQLTETRETYSAHTTEHDPEVTSLNGSLFQLMLLQLETDDTLKHASCSVSSLTALL